MQISGIRAYEGSSSAKTLRSEWEQQIQEAARMRPVGQDESEGRHKR